MNNRRRRKAKHAREFRYLTLHTVLDGSLRDMQVISRLRELFMLMGGRAFGKNQNLRTSPAGAAFYMRRIDY